MEIMKMKLMKRSVFGLICLIGLLCIPIGVNAAGYKIGDRIEFGQKAGQPLVWDVIHVDAQGNPLLFSSEVLAWKAFDSNDRETDYYRKYAGSNRWTDSTIRQWLNSTEENVSWRNGVPHTAGVEPAHLAYADESGFLHTSFTEYERSALLDVTRNVLIDEKDQLFRHSGKEHPIYEQKEDGSMRLTNGQSVYREHVTDKMFLLTIDEVERYLSKMKYLLPGKISKAIESEPYQKTHLGAYWLVAPDYKGSTSMVMDTLASNSFYNANEGLGIRPAFYLNKSHWLAKSGDGTLDAPYTQADTSVKMNTKRLVLFVGEGGVIDYSVNPVNRRALVNWRSASPQIASVNERGVVFGRKVGKTTVTTTSQTGQVETVRIEVKSGAYKPTVKTYKIDSSQRLFGNIDSYGAYLTAFSDIGGGTAILKDKQRQLHFIYETEKDVRLVVYDHLFKLKKRITFKKEWSMFGDIVLDASGHYYILWGRELKESDYKSASIMISKYDSNGKLLKSTTWNGKKLNTKIPFDAGNARITYQNGKLVAHFARIMFRHSDGLNHQASQVVFADAVTMKPIESPKPYVSHSLNQQVLPMKDGSLLFVDQGDGGSRGFEINHLVGGDMIEFTPFQFREGEDWSHGYNKTFAQLGGIAEGKVGYSLLGSSEKTLSAAPAKTARNESRNLFLQFFRTDTSRYEMTGDTDDLFLVTGETRKIVGKRPTTGEGRYFLEAGTFDKNVRWITNYKGNVDAAHPKLVETDDGRYIVMWEEFHQRQFKRVKMQVFSAYGDVLLKAVDVPNVRLPIAEDVLYQNGFLYWTTVKYNQSTQKDTIQVHRLKVD